MPAAHNDKFAQLEAEAARLREAFEAQRITATQLEQQMKELMVQDDQGVWWTVGSKTGEWFRHNGKEWMRGVPPRPPISTPASPPISQSSPGPKVSAAKPMKQTESSDFVSPVPTSEHLQSSPRGSRGRFRRLCLAAFCAALFGLPLVYGGISEQNENLGLFGIVLGIVVFFLVLKAEAQRKKL